MSEDLFFHSKLLISAVFHMEAGLLLYVNGTIRAVKPE